VLFNEAGQWNTQVPKSIRRGVLPKIRRRIRVEMDD
jgi:hypothetical protein